MYCPLPLSSKLWGLLEDDLFPCLVKLFQVRARYLAIYSLCHLFVGQCALLNIFDFNYWPGFICGFRSLVVGYNHCRWWIIDIPASWYKYFPERATLDLIITGNSPSSFQTIWCLLSSLASVFLLHSLKPHSLSNLSLIVQIKRL